jgi:UDP-GlcNAc:undecaprenyl-phosphate GlcNAc-1-phosphate transferase
MSNFLFFYFFINLLFFFYYKPISIFYNLFDYPDNIRKLQKHPIPLLGGLFIATSLFLIFFLCLFIKFTEKDFIIFTDNQLSFFLISYLFFFLGYFDDKYQIRANIKLLIMIIFILLALLLDKNLLLNDLRFLFHSESLTLGYYSYLVTVLCFLLFINAFNMLDGLNGQAITYAIFILSIFIFNGVFTNLSILLVITSLFFLFLNLKNRAYLGDSGSLTLGFILSFLFLKSYNLNNKFHADEIFIIMCIPGYELLRLAIKRIFKKKHPFSPDSNHIHHLMIRNFNFIKSYFIIQLLLITPYILYLVLKNFYISLILSLLVYSLSVYLSSKKNENKLL